MATEKQLIKKLPTGSTSEDGIWWEKHPTRRDIIEKIDEIIEALNILLKESHATDAVEVVRCKDCRHWIERTADGIDTFHTCWFNDSITGRTHFCRYGERRTDA